MKVSALVCHTAPDLIVPCLNFWDSLQDPAVLTIILLNLLNFISDLPCIFVFCFSIEKYCNELIFSKFQNPVNLWIVYIIGQTHKMCYKYLLIVSQFESMHKDLCIYMYTYAFKFMEYLHETFCRKKLGTGHLKYLNSSICIYCSNPFTPVSRPTLPHFIYLLICKPNNIIMRCVCVSHWVISTSLWLHGL